MRISPSEKKLSKQTKAYIYIQGLLLEIGGGTIKCLKMSSWKKRDWTWLPPPQKKRKKSRIIYIGRKKKKGFATILWKFEENIYRVLKV